MADIISAPFRFRALPVTTAAWGAIPNQQGYEGVTTTIDLTSFFTQGMPETTSFTVALYSDSGGTTALQNTHDLYDTATISYSSGSIELEFDLGSVDIAANTDVYVRVTAEQPDP